LLENYRCCLAAINDTLINESERQVQLRQSQAPVEQPAMKEFRIVEQRLQHTVWPTWSHEQQIENSIATDTESATSGKLFIPPFCFLELKPK
jgi:hypothetical protein